MVALQFAALLINDASCHATKALQRFNAPNQQSCSWAILTPPTIAGLTVVMSPEHCREKLIPPVSVSAIKNKSLKGNFFGFPHEL
jgi:hypothetical protein